MQSQQQSVAPLDDAAKRALVIGLMLAMLVGALDQTIVATALPTIGRELGGAELLPWVVTTYLVTSTATAPLYGKISDIYGRRLTLLACLAMFLVNSVICALAPNMLTLVIGRTLQGVGGGGLMLLAQSAIADVISARERGKFQVYIAGVFVISSVAGPLVGGVLADKWHWSTIFWLNVPLCIAAMWTTNKVLKRTTQQLRDHKLDIAGSIILVLGTVAVLLALNWGGHRYAWTSPVILGLFAVAALFTVVFIVHLRRAAEPLLPLDVLGNAVVRSASLTAVSTFGTFIGLTIFLPFYIETVHGLTPSLAGVALLAFLGGGVTGASISGRLLAWTGRYKPSPSFGVPIGALALVALGFGFGDENLWVFIPLLLAAGTGIGTTFSSLIIAMQNAVARHDIGVATGTFNFARSLGAAFIVAIYGAFVLSGLGGEALAMEGVRGAASHHAGIAEVATVYRHIFFFAALTLAVCLPILWRIEERPLKG
jgi:MFS family permease